MSTPRRGVVVLGPRGAPRVLRTLHEVHEPPRRKRPDSRVPWKGVFVVFLAAAGSTLMIRASDTLTYDDKTQLAAVGAVAKEERCPSDMVLIPSERGGYCIDRYEVAPKSTCRYDTPANQYESNDNIVDERCVGVSESGLVPWTNVTLDQAERICAKSGKRLPTSAEWHHAALGTPDRMTKDPRDCAIGYAGRDRAFPSGVREHCVSSYGTYDMAGNVWEWVAETVRDGVLDGQQLPDEGFVSAVDADGTPVKTATSSDPLFGGDYFFVDKSGTRGIFRGGFWGMDEKAGVYAGNTTIETSFVGYAVGFRCAR